MYIEKKIAGGTVCGLLVEAEPKPEVKIEKAVEEKPKAAKTAPKKKNTGK